MLKKKNNTRPDLITAYMKYVVEHGSQPVSVNSFAKANNMKEIEFYEQFVSFEALEQAVFRVLFDKAHDLLEKNKEYLSFDARNKLLSFYFTFFELLTANRSYIVHTLQLQKNNLKKIRSLNQLKKRFTLYINHLKIPMVCIEEENLKKIQVKGLKETAWAQFLFTLKFWLDDTSPSFEKTDIFIEKAVNTSFDLIEIKPLNSVFDFGKFLFKEKIKVV